MRGVFLFSAIFSIFALVVITIFLLASGIPFIAETGFGKFVLGTEWSPMEDNPVFGIFPMVVASIYTTALSVAFGITLGLATAIALYKFCPAKLVGPIRQMINLLSGIPSVIFGLFGMTIIVPFVRDYLSPTGVGYGIFSSSIVLAIMILPTIVGVSLDSLQALPSSYYEGALALGATKQEATFKVMLRSAKSGILAGVVLAIGRAIGETMAVIMVIGGSPEMPNSIFQSVRTLTANIALGALELDDQARQALIATGVVLFVFTLILNISFSFLKRSSTKKPKPKRSPKNSISTSPSENDAIQPIVATSTTNDNEFVLSLNDTENCNLLPSDTAMSNAPQGLSSSDDVQGEKYDH